MDKNIKYIIENKFNFNPADYSDDNSNIIDNQVISNLTYKYFPKTKEELLDIIFEKFRKNPVKPYLNDICTTYITDMGYIFNPWRYSQRNIDIKQLKELDLSCWDMSNVSTTSGMFLDCIALEKINLSGWDTSNVINMYSMFNGCKKLQDIIGLSSLDTSSVNDMDFMFFNCESIKELDLSRWNTLLLNYKNGMFTSCSSLRLLNLSGWKYFDFKEKNEGKFKNLMIIWNKNSIEKINDE